jgi:hypothetical protein
VNNGKSWNWRIEPMTAQVKLYAGHCRAKGCHALAQCYVAFDFFVGRRPHATTARKVMCRAHAEAVVKKHATLEKV